MVIQLKNDVCLHIYKCDTKHNLFDNCNQVFSYETIDLIAAKFSRILQRISCQSNQQDPHDYMNCHNIKILKIEVAVATPKDAFTMFPSNMHDIYFDLPQSFVNSHF